MFRMKTQFGMYEQYTRGGIKFASTPSGVAANTSITVKEFLQHWHKAKVRENSRHSAIQAVIQDVNLGRAVGGARLLPVVFVDRCFVLE